MSETEIIQERGETYKVFDLGNHKKRYECRCKPIHYTDERTGAWKDIDVRLRLSTDLEKHRDNYLADENRFTAGLRADCARAKTLGIRYRGKKEYQFEVTPEVIILGKDNIPLPDTYSKITLLDDYHIENIITPDVAIETRLHEVHTRAAVRTTRDIDDFKIVFKLDLTGFRIKNTFKSSSSGKEYIPDRDNRFYFESVEGQDIWIPTPKMWMKPTGRLTKEELKRTVLGSSGINHRLYEENGVLYYEKTPTTEGKEWLKTATGTVYIDADTYYAETSDGRVETRGSSKDDVKTKTTLHAKYNNENNSWNTNGINHDAGVYTTYHVYFWFDTSAISPDVVTSASLFTYGYYAEYGDVAAVKSTQDDSFSNWEANAWTGSEYGHISPLDYQYNELSFNSTGVNDIVTDGTTKICTLNYTWDYLDVDWSGQYNISGLYFADNNGTDYDPYLSITVTAAGAPLFDIEKLGLEPLTGL